MLTAAAAGDAPGVVPAAQLDDQVEAFMRRQAELESGGAHL